MVWPCTCFHVHQPASKSLSRLYNRELIIFSRSKQRYKLTYWTILPFNPCQNWPSKVQWGILFVISSCTYRDQEFFPGGGRRHFCWCWCVKKYRTPCLSWGIILCLVVQWAQVQERWLFFLLFSTLLSCGWNCSLKAVPLLRSANPLLAIPTH